MRLSNFDFASFKMPSFCAGMEVPDWVLGLRDTSPGLEGTSGRDIFGDNNPFEVHFPDLAQPAGEAPTLPGVESNTDTAPSGPAMTPAEFVHELSPVEGHMINPLTGDGCYLLSP